MTTVPRVAVCVLLHAPGEPKVERIFYVEGFDRWPADDTDADDFYAELIETVKARDVDPDDIDDWYKPAAAVDPKLRSTR